MTHWDELPPENKRYFMQNIWDISVNEKFASNPVVAPLLTAESATEMVEFFDLAKHYSSESHSPFGQPKHPLIEEARRAAYEAKEKHRAENSQKQADIRKALYLIQIKPSGSEAPKRGVQSITKYFDRLRAESDAALLATYGDTASVREHFMGGRIAPDEFWPIMMMLKGNHVHWSNDLLPPWDVAHHLSPIDRETKKGEPIDWFSYDGRADALVSLFPVVYAFRPDEVGCYCTYAKQQVSNFLEAATESMGWAAMLWNIRPDFRPEITKRVTRSGNSCGLRRFARLLESMSDIPEELSSLFVQEFFYYDQNNAPTPFLTDLLNAKTPGILEKVYPGTHLSLIHI